MGFLKMWTLKNIQKITMETYSHVPNYVTLFGDRALKSSLLKITFPHHV